jgi:hypothetical protein
MIAAGPRKRIASPSPGERVGRELQALDIYPEYTGYFWTKYYPKSLRRN